MSRACTRRGQYRIPLRDIRRYGEEGPPSQKVKRRLLGASQIDQTDGSATRDLMCARLAGLHNVVPAAQSDTQTGKKEITFGSAHSPRGALQVLCCLPLPLYGVALMTTIKTAAPQVKRGWSEARLGLSARAKGSAVGRLLSLDKRAGE